jgi:tRNA threonylcarbamoyl adenosine modification protein YeaZ
MHHETYIAIDTAYELGMVVVFNKDGILFERALPSKLDHAKDISGAIALALDFCQSNDLELAGFFCGLGPGSFVGVRIALSTALGFCTASDMPLMGFCSHRALVRSKNDCAIFMKASGDLGYLTCFSVKELVKIKTPSQVVALSDVKDKVLGLELFSDQAEKFDFFAQKITGPTALGIYEACMENLPGFVDQKSFIKPNYVKPPSVTPPKNLSEVFVVPGANIF